MYGSHHRVASLRRGAVTERPLSHTATPCETHSGTPHPTQTESLHNTQRCWPPYTVPASLRHSRLAPPLTPTPTPLATQQQLQQTQLQQQQPLQQTQQSESPGIAAAVRGVSEALAQQQKHMIAGCRSLALLAALVDGQRAQVAALNGLADEVRAVAGAIRDTAKPQERPMRDIRGESVAQRQQSAGEAMLVLGGKDSDSEGESEAGRGEESGAAYAQGTQLRPVMLKSMRGTSQFVEDDVFSM